ncbi:hypothetical protein K438DRAFT_1760680 [Mycena galopus ATCC 62051]|nr:hypothetical protein K438DRAFT_1760680 [Mycena galopus ATCC 62051]
MSAAGALTALAATPPLDVDGAALEWAVLELSHRMQWEFHIVKISLENVQISQKEQAEWEVARFLNSRSRSKDDPFIPMPMRFARVPIPDIPPLAPGTAENLPPPFTPPPIVVPAVHPMFPADMAELRGLTGQNLDALLLAYGRPLAGQNLPIDEKRAIFARHIGVAL